MATQDKPRRTDLDPRPDLTEDHEDWVAVLAIAWHKDKRVHGLLHGLRCGGARLERLRSRTGGEFFKLDYKPLLETWNEDELLEQWLKPNRGEIKGVFDQALLMLNSVAADTARRVG